MAGHYHFPWQMEGAHKMIIMLMIDKWKPVWYAYIGLEVLLSLYGGEVSVAPCVLFLRFSASAML